MVKVGDYIEIKRTNFNQEWYDDRIFQVVDINIDNIHGVVITLDKEFPISPKRNDFGILHNSINLNHVKILVKHTRTVKIKNIFND